MRLSCSNDPSLDLLRASATGAQPGGGTSSARTTIPVYLQAHMHAHPPPRTHTHWSWIWTCAFMAVQAAWPGCSSPLEGLSTAAGACTPPPSAGPDAVAHLLPAPAGLFSDGATALSQGGGGSIPAPALSLQPGGGGRPAPSSCGAPAAHAQQRAVPELGSLGEFLLGRWMEEEAHERALLARGLAMLQQGNRQ